MIYHNIFITSGAILYSMAGAVCMIWPGSNVYHMLTSLACVAPFYTTSLYCLCDMALRKHPDTSCHPPHTNRDPDCMMSAETMTSSGRDINVSKNVIIVCKMCVQGFVSPGECSHWWTDTNLNIHNITSLNFRSIL